MGLDMYLQARQYVSGYEHNPKEEIDRYKRIVAEIGLPPDICPHIDEYYKEDLEQTVEQLTSILNNEKLKNFSFYYHASW